jgi:hypothetical protein
MKKSYRLALLNADLKVFFFLILGLVICEWEIFFEHDRF